RQHHVHDRSGLEHHPARRSHIPPIPSTWTDSRILPKTRKRVLTIMTSKPTRPTSPRFRSNLTSTKTLLDSLVRLNPLSLLANPVMFIVELTFFIVAAMAIYPPAFYPVANLSMRIYYVEVSMILLTTVCFSTIDDALAATQEKTPASILSR